MINLGNEYDSIQPLQPGESVRLPAGGYVCIVTNAVVGSSAAGSPLLTIYLDILEGDFKAHFQNAKFPPRIFQSIFDKNNKPSPYFKGLMKNFENSNSGFSVSNGYFDEKSLVNKKIGVIFGDVEREYNGKIYTDARPAYAVTVDKIHSNDFKIPDVKKVESTQYKPTAIDDDFIGDTIPDSSVPF